MTINFDRLSDGESVLMGLAIGLDLASGIGSYIVTKKALYNVVGPSTKLERCGISGIGISVGASVLNQMPLTNLVNGIISIKKGN